MKEVILITGSTGFVGFRTLITALEAGYNVRAVIRKEEQAVKIKAHVRIAPHADRLEYAVVTVLTEDGAFDNVLGDVVAVLHIASPLAVETDEYERDIISPAIKIGTSLLHSALKVSTIRRIIITSSLVTLMPWEWLFNSDDRLWTANDLNVDPNRSVSSSMEAYWTSKALARAAVKEFVEHAKPHFETIQLLPGVIIGRDERAASVADLRRDTPQWLMRMAPILGEKQSDPMGSVPVDVEDVAKAHVDAITDTVPGNSDYTLCTGPTADIVWDDMIETAKRYFPEKAGSRNMPLDGTLPTMKWLVDTTKTEKAYGWKFKTFEETMKGMIGQYVELLG